MKELILGGARSGKSGEAARHALESSLKVVYIATATIGDEEMAARIAHHQRLRPDDWMLLEEPLALAKTLESNASPDRCLLIDCLTLWLTNLLAENEARFRQEVKDFLQLLPQLTGHIILVSNETGMGVVPMGALTRQFIDEAGWLHQQLAQLCDRVTLMVAGLPFSLKG